MLLIDRPGVASRIVFSYPSLPRAKEFDPPVSEGLLTALLKVKPSSFAKVFRANQLQGEQIRSMTVEASGEAFSCRESSEKNCRGRMKSCSFATCSVFDFGDENDPGGEQHLNMFSVIVGFVNSGSNVKERVHENLTRLCHSLQREEIRNGYVERGGGFAVEVEERDQTKTKSEQQHKKGGEDDDENNNNNNNNNNENKDENDHFDDDDFISVQLATSELSRGETRGSSNPSSSGGGAERAGKGGGAGGTGGATARRGGGGARGGGGRGEGARAPL